ncbi:MAG: glycosyltransferase family 4 protein [Epsilonproteobacteria bacterium]|nr:glycosyltransferase family 4 protein [Campylobacterota bacterium]
MEITFINRMMGIKIGGGESFDLNLARALKKRGHKIRFIVGSQKNAPTFLDREFDEVIYIKTPYLRNIHYKFQPTNIFNKVISVGASMIDGTLFENKVFSFLKNREFGDIYQLCGLSELGERLEKRGKRCSVFWPGPPSLKREKSIKACSLHFSHGDSINRLKLMIDNVYEILPGVDTEVFYPSIEKEKRDRVRLIFVGRLVPVKNIPFLIKAFNEALMEFENMELAIVGEGPMEEELRKLAYKNIEFLGFLNEEELAKEYRNSDIFCIVSSYESFSIVTLEAMASSLPVIVSNVGYLPSLAEDNGIVVERDNVKALKEAILRLAKNRELREEMGKMGYEKVIKNYSWEESAKKVEKLYEKVLENEVSCN